MKKEEEKQRKVEHEKRIEDAIESYEFRPKVERDEQRLLKETEALITRKKTVYDKADKIALVPVHGYNITQLMSDMKFRLQTALHDAGIAHTEYANQVMNKLSRPNY